MAVKVVFLASLREALEVGELELPLPAEGLRISQVTALLVERFGARGEALTAENVRVAVNHSVAHGDTELRDGDELAYLPPVTGG